MWGRKRPLQQLVLLCTLSLPKAWSYPVMSWIYPILCPKIANDGYFKGVIKIPFIVRQCSRIPSKALMKSDSLASTEFPLTLQIIPLKPGTIQCKPDYHSLAFGDLFVPGHITISRFWHFCQFIDCKLKMLEIKKQTSFCLKI